MDVGTALLRSLRLASLTCMTPPRAREMEGAIAILRVRSTSDKEQDSCNERKWAAEIVFSRLSTGPGNRIVVFFFNCEV